MPTCLITGTNRGLGLEFVRQYAADDWKVIATCRRPDEAEALGAVEGSVQIYPLDVTNFARIEQLARKLSGVAIDLLINHAGIYGPHVTPYHNIEYGAWCEVLRVNTMAPLKMSAAFLDHLNKGQHKKIVTISSKMGSITDNTSGGAYIYRSSKAALNAVMKSLSMDLRDQGFTVVVLNPGWVRTDMGGSNASIDSFESVAGQREVINNLRIEDSGRFLHYDGSEIPW